MLNILTKAGCYIAIIILGIHGRTSGQQALHLCGLATEKAAEQRWKKVCDF